MKNNGVLIVCFILKGNYNTGAVKKMIYSLWGLLYKGNFTTSKR